MKRSLIFGLLFASLATQSSAQVAPALSDKMKPLAFLVGDWKGEGWMMTRSGKVESLSFETVAPKAGGTVLMIDGLGKDKTSGKETHNAFGILRFDETAQKYKLTSYLSSGQTGEFDVVVGDKSLVWEIKSEQRHVRYTMKIDDQGRWHEIGEVNLGNDKWMQFLEMTLTRSS